MMHNMMHVEESGFTKGLNHLSDWTEEEYQRLLGDLGDSDIDEEADPVWLDESAAPASIDWRQQGAVTPIKNQGSCGSCWSFSASGSMEGINKIKTGKLVELSTQQALDCSVAGSCSGGYFEKVFYYAKTNKMESFSDYPYAGKKQTCAYNAGKG